MKYIEVNHPDAKQKIMDAGISVRRNKKGVGQAIELAGEHSYMHSAKTGSGLTNSQTKPATLCKWVLCRRYQAKFSNALKTMTGIDKSSDTLRKCLRPSQILKSDEIAIGINSCLKTPFTDPFCEDLGNVNLISYSFSLIHV